MNLYIGITSNDKSICKFDWEGDGLFLMIRTAGASPATKEYKLYWQNLNDTIRYEEPSPNWGAGQGYLFAPSTVNDSSDVDHGYSAELMVRLDSLGYTFASPAVQMSLVRFDPNHLQHPMVPWDTLHGTFYKSWWGSEWGGIWRVVKLDQTVGVAAAQGEIPTSFALSQNFPNPFNPSTTIRFDVPVSSSVSIVVYDITGREVHTLVRGEYEPGVYNTVLDGNHLASGVYIYRMMTTPHAGSTMPAYVSTRKLILLK